MAELYIANAIKRSFNAALGFNLTILDFGHKAAQRSAEMAHADPREYLGESVAGGEVARGMSSILALRAPAAMNTATVSARAAVRSGMGSRGVTQRAEEMDLGGFVFGLLTWVFSPITHTIAVLWGLLSALFSICFWLATAASLIYFAVQGMVSLNVLATVLRRIWREYGLYELVGATSRSLVWLVVQTILLPIRIVIGIVRVVGATAWWQDLQAFSRRSRDAFFDGLEYAVRNLRCSALTDWIWLHYYLFTNWLSRNGFRISLAVLLCWVGWQHLSGQPVAPGLSTPAPEGDGVVQFRDMREMAAYFGIPQDHFLPKREQGSNWLGGSGVVWEGVRGIGIGMDVAEERMAMRDGIPEGWEEAIGEWEVEAAPETVVDEAVSVLPMPPVEDLVPEPAKSVKSKWMGREWMAYCRQCRQKHCCEHMDAEPASLDLFPEF